MKARVAIFNLTGRASIWWENFGHLAINPKGSRSGARRRKRSSNGSSDYQGSIGGSSSSSHRNERKRPYQNHSRDEFKKVRSPTFNGEIKNG